MMKFERTIAGYYRASANGYTYEIRKYGRLWEVYKSAKNVAYVGYGCYVGSTYTLRDSKEIAEQDLAREIELESEPTIDPIEETPAEEPVEFTEEFLNRMEELKRQGKYYDFEMEQKVNEKIYELCLSETIDDETLSLASHLEECSTDDEWWNIYHVLSERFGFDSNNEPVEVQYHTCYVLDGEIGYDDYDSHDYEDALAEYERLKTLKDEYLEQNKDEDFEICIMFEKVITYPGVDNYDFQLLDTFLVRRASGTFDGAYFSKEVEQVEEEPETSSSVDDSEYEYYAEKTNFGDCDSCVYRDDCGSQCELMWNNERG